MSAPKSGLAWHTAALLLGVVFAAAPIASMAARGPASENAIPVYPGARPFSDKEDLRQLAESMQDGGSDVRSQSARGFTTSATPEEVVAWYRRQLSPVPRSGDFDERLKPGATGEVQEELSFYRFNAFDDADGGKARRARMEKDRKPYSPGQWIASAELVWNKREANGDDSWFTVSIEDRSYRVDGSFGRKTDITIRRITQKRNGLPGHDDD